MARAEQIKSLIQSHLQGEGDRFLTTALQLAAHEAHKGDTSFAHEIRSIIDKQKKPARLRVVASAGGSRQPYQHWQPHVHALSILC